MEIELEDSIHEFTLRHCQIEITGRCNLKCAHCRAANDPKTDMDEALFTKCLDFCEAGKGFNVTISGGEPFLHPRLLDFLKVLERRECGEIVITSNGFSVPDEVLKKIKAVALPQVTIQISLDSPDRETHDKFRGVPGSFDKATAAVGRIKAAGLFPSIRCTFSPGNIDRAEEMVNLAIRLGSRRIGIGSVVPSGAAKENKELIFSREKKKELLETMLRLKAKYPGIEVVSGDPLKFAIESSVWYKENIKNKDTEGFFGGCEAGISGINVDSEGNITPCALLKRDVINLAALPLDKAREAYCVSPIIKNLFERKFGGKCGRCDLKKLCGGCRAIPDGICGDYLAEDPTCFREVPA